MKTTAVFAFAMFWQSALLVNIGTPADPAHLRFRRAIQVAPGTSGLVCAVLDPLVLAHAASAAQEDLRLYRGFAGSAVQAEMPYLLTESGPEPIADTQVPAEHVLQNGPEIQFDLRMPARAYSELNLHLRLQNFVATVHVSAEAQPNRPENLGTFGVYDLTGQRLGRWTVLPLAENRAPLLHLRLDLRTPEGKPLRAGGAAVIEGAAVPPSRERQTLFSPVAATTAVERRAAASLVRFHIPAHVPVERVRFELAPGSGGNFYREVTVQARPDRQDLAETEILDAGAIEHVQLPSGDPGVNRIDVQQLTADATIGSTLASSAQVRVFVHNGDLAPLPIRRVTLEMRERRLCFLAGAGAVYTLRYGDPALSPPVYDTSGLLTESVSPGAASLGPEERNPAWKPRDSRQRYLDRHPELFWLVVLLCGGMMGGTALHYIQHRGVVKRG